MQVKHGLISCDSHGQLDRDAWTSRMSKAKWGDRIPQVIEVEDNGEKVERWTVNGKVQSGVAIENASGFETTVNFELTGLDGTSTGRTGQLTIPGMGQRSLFLGQIPGYPQ